VPLPQRLNQLRLIREGACPGLIDGFRLAALESLGNLFELLAAGDEVGDDRLVLLLLPLDKAYEVLNQFLLLVYEG